MAKGINDTIKERGLSNEKFNVHHSMGGERAPPRHSHHVMIRFARSKAALIRTTLYNLFLII